MAFMSGTGGQGGSMKESSYLRDERSSGSSILNTRATVGGAPQSASSNRKNDVFSEGVSWGLEGEGRTGFLVYLIVVYCPFLVYCSCPFFCLPFFFFIFVL